ALARTLRPHGALILDVREWGASAERKTREPIFRKRVSTDRGELTFTSVTVTWDSRNKRYVFLQLLPRFQRTLAMKIVALSASLSLAAALLAEPPPPPLPRVLLAVTAHPDDEAFMGPILARYARQGVKVYLTIATKGEKGANDFAKIPAGEPLAIAR